MTLDEIQELAGHRAVPAWVIKLVQDAVEAEKLRLSLKIVSEVYYDDVIADAILGGNK